MKLVVTAKVKFPFEPIDKPKELATSVIQQVTVVEQAPDYPNQGAGQTQATATLAAANAVLATESAIGTNIAQRINLETTRDTQVTSLQLAHDGLRTALNTAS